MTDLSSLSNLINLTYLDLTDCGVWYPDEIINVDFLAKLKNLTSLDLSGCFTFEIKPDGHLIEEKSEDVGESVYLKGEELKSYLQKIRDHVSSK